MPNIFRVCNAISRSSGDLQEPLRGMAFREKRKNGLLCRHLMNDDDSPPHHDGTCSTNVISNFSDSGDALKIKSATFPIAETPYKLLFS